MPENTNKKPNAPGRDPVTTLEPTRASRSDEIRSAQILMQEGLVEEAKKKLFQVLINAPNYARAQKLLQEIQDQELKGILSQTRPTPKRPPTKSEDTEAIIRKLNMDLGLQLDMQTFNPDKENWIIKTELSPRERYDLGVAFFEMGCYRDAIKQLRASEKQIRIEQTFLGELGVSVVALYAESLVLLGQAFEAKQFLDPIILEPELNIDEKIVLFYVMGLTEEKLGNLNAARGWFQQVSNQSPDFREVRFRLAQFS